MKTLSGVYAIKMMKLTDTVDNIQMNGKFFKPGLKSRWSFFIPENDFAVFQPRILTDFSSVEKVQVRMFNN